MALLETNCLLCVVGEGKALRLAAGLREQRPATSAFDAWTLDRARLGVQFVLAAGCIATQYGKLARADALEASRL